MDQARVSARLLVRTGVLVMVQGFKPDARSRNVQDLQVTSASGEPVAATYDPQGARWTLPLPGPQEVLLSYVVDLGKLRTLPAWAHLQYGFFEGDAAYLVTSCLFIAPDTAESTDAASVTIEPPPGADLAAPWAYEAADRPFSSTVAALVNNSIVVGKFPTASYREGDLSVTAVLLGKWLEQRALVERVLRAAVAQELLLFPGTPAGRYLVTLSSGDEDGQSFTTSNSISTRLPISADDTEIWANTIAHELFHHWNGGLIHTKDQRLAFFVEGFTEYYANRQVLQATLVDAQRFWNMAAFHLGAYSYFRYSPNYDVSIAGAGSNKSKNRFGVYDGGWAVALCLDLELRAASANQSSLDGVMRLLWQRYGQTGEALTYDGLVKAVSDVAGHDMAPFFLKYVAGQEELPFRSDLARIGVAAYDQPFGGEAYVKVRPRTPAERRAYNGFLSPASGNPPAPARRAPGRR